MDSSPRQIDGQLYYHYSTLQNWDKNNTARSITDKNWAKLVADIARNGIEDDFKIDSNGIVYDGNHRLKAIKHLITERNQPTSQNGKDLQWIPVKLVNPQSEADKWRIALVRNEDFANWDREGLSNFLPEFEGVLDESLINVNFDPNSSINDQLEEMADEYEKTMEELDKKTTNRQVKCPSCGHEFSA